jgi:hypothetical protein
VQRFFHLFQALSAWAALDESITPLGPNRRHRLHVMQRVADAEIDGIGLPQLQSALILWSR